MKKIVALLAALILMMLAATAMAEAARPGDTVTVAIYVNTSDAAYVKVRVSGDWCTVTGVSAVYGQASGKNIIVEYGISIVEVCKIIKSQVCYKIENMTGAKVRRVNISVEGIRV